jgi:hypothetical protein
MTFKYLFYSVLLFIVFSPFIATSQNWDVKVLKVGYTSELVYCAKIDRIFVAAENKIVVINPNLGTITDSIVVGGNVPTQTEIYKIAVSDDAKYLYYAKRSDLKIIRYNLLTKLKEFEFTPDESFLDMEVMPGKSQTLALTRSSSRDVAIYDGAVRRPKTTKADFDVLTNIIFAYNDSTTIYASQDWSTNNLFSIVKVDNLGATIKSKTYNFISEFRGRFAASKDGFVYTNNGIKINLNAASTPIKEGIYGDRGNLFLTNLIQSGFFAADPILDKVYCLVQGRDLDNQTDSTQLAIYNKKTFNLEQIFTFPIKFTFGNYISELTECGSAKLATLSGDKVILIRQCPSANTTKPSILEGIKKTGCYDSTLTLTASGNNSRYIWSNGDTGRIIKVSAGNVYLQSISVATIDTEGCLSPYSTPITVNFEQRPDAASLFVGDQKTTTCRGDSINLIAANLYNAYSVVWSNGATSNNIWVKQTGDYSFYALTPNGCKTPSTPIQKVTVYNFNIPPRPTIKIEQGDTVLCQGASITLSTPTGYSLYKWSNGDNTRVTTIIPSSTQDISVRVSDTNGCQSAPSVPMALEVIYKPFDRPTIILNGNTLASSKSQGNQWFLNGNPIQGATQQFFMPTQRGTYTAKFAERAACLSESSNAIEY